MKYAILVSQFNKEITTGLKNGALEFFKEVGLSAKDIETFDAPGAFELPLLAQTLAKTKLYSGIVCLGAVIKGDTAHFEFISLGATIGIQQAALNTGVPISFGILTTYTEDQAYLRSVTGSPHNKGREAAQACYVSVNFISKLTAAT